jgi:peptidoglycan hydrolase-like protein with peptidoglycan-binding domain
MTLKAMTMAAIISLAAAAPSFAQTPVSQLNMSAVPKLDSDGVRKVQTLLKQKGIAAGPLDGVAGPLTRAAIRTFQERYGMKPSGDIDNQLLLGLGAVELAGGGE